MDEVFNVKNVKKEKISEPKTTKTKEKKVEKKQEKTVEKMEIVSWWRTVHFSCFLTENALIDININKGKLEKMETDSWGKDTKNTCTKNGNQRLMENCKL